MASATEGEPRDPGGGATAEHEIGGWFAGRIPDGWFTSAPEVEIDREEILVVGTLAEPELPDGADDETARSARVARIEGFREKPRLDCWINGGFFCLEPAFIDYVTASSVLEREPLEHAADDGQLAAFRHDGFWDCMDTYKDAIVLNDLWAGGEPPWRVWSAARKSRTGQGNRCPANRHSILNWARSPSPIRSGRGPLDARASESELEFAA